MNCLGVTRPYFGYYDSLQEEGPLIILEGSPRGTQRPLAIRFERANILLGAYRVVGGRTHSPAGE